MLLALIFSIIPSPRMLLSHPPIPSPRITSSDDTDYYELRFSGIRPLFSPGCSDRLASARVCVVGLGGVGSWAVEALARSGIGGLTLVDLDEVCISNTNRQLHATLDSIGRSKAAVLADRIALINPACQVIVREQWLTAPSAVELLEEEQARNPPSSSFAVLDAIDGYIEKAAIIAACASSHSLQRAHCVTVGAAGGKADPTQVRCADLSLATHDALLRRVRKQLRKEHGFPLSSPHASAEWGVPAVFSTEPSVPPSRDGSSCDRYGTACFGTGAFGFAAAAQLTRAIAEGEAAAQIVGGGGERRAGGPHMCATCDLDSHSGRDGELLQRMKEGSGERVEIEESSGRGEIEADSVALTQTKGVGKCRGTADEGEGAWVDEGVNIFDSHCHAIEGASQLLLSPRAAGVCFVSTGEKEWEMAATTEYHALGVHPWYVHRQAEGWVDRLHRMLTQQTHASVGEAGIDKLQLAVKLRRALVVHCVRAYGWLFDKLRSSGSALPPVLVLHAYGGSVESALAFLKLPSRVYFGFSPSALRLKRAKAGSSFHASFVPRPMRLKAAVIQLLCLSTQSSIACRRPYVVHAKHALGWHRPEAGMKHRRQA
ncbi:MAG: hypothetical protein SGPRY_001965 [Prymnesium sp.]